MPRTCSRCTNAPMPIARRRGKGSGQPRRLAYGETEIETARHLPDEPAPAPIFVFIHGGAWRNGAAGRSATPAEMFVASGAHYVALDFTSVEAAGGNLSTMANQVRRAVAWVYRNAGEFGGDPQRLYVGGHSSGAHLAGGVLTTDWGRIRPAGDIIKGGDLLSGMYDLKPVRLSARSPMSSSTMPRSRR